jgi:hypothetical protein
VDVDPGVGGQRELVAAERARQRRRAVDAALLEQCAQLRHQHAERLFPGRRKLLAPERLGELVPRHGTPHLHGQIREHDPSLAAGEALLVQPRTVRLDCKALDQRDSNAQVALPSSPLAAR